MGYHDMFDLREKVLFSLKHILSNLDEEQSYRPYFWTEFGEDPVTLQHDWADFGDVTSRYVEALLYIRAMTGEGEGKDIENKLRELFFSFFSERDGLSYRPERLPEYSYLSGTEYTDHVADMFDQSRVISALAALYMAEGEEWVGELAVKFVDRLSELVVWKGNHCYLPKKQYEPGEKIDRGLHTKPPREIYYTGVLIRPLFKIYKLLGLQKAFDIAAGFVEFIIGFSEVFGEDGSYGDENDNLWHTHSILATAAGIIAGGIIIGRKDWIEFGEKVYLYTKKYCSLSGWVPEGIGRGTPDREGCETCSVMDYLDCAILLAKSLDTKYWDDVDRIVRNQLSENQLRDTSWWKNSVSRERTRNNYYGKDASERMLGAFAGWSGPNSFTSNPHYGQTAIMHCCSGAGVKAMFLAWDNIVKCEGNMIFINLHMNYCSNSVEIRSFIPSMGRVEIKIKTASDVFVRLPGWVEDYTFHSEKNGVEIEKTLKDGYLIIPGCNAGDVIVLNILLPLYSTSENIHGSTYTFHWYGSDVIKVEPEGTGHALYTGKKRMIFAQPDFKEFSCCLTDHKIHW